MIILLEGINDTRKNKYKKELLSELSKRNVNCCEYEIDRIIEKYTEKQFWNEFATLLHRDEVYIISSFIIRDMIYRMLSNVNLLIDMSSIMTHFDSPFVGHTLTIVYFENENLGQNVRTMYSIIMAAIQYGTQVPVLTDDTPNLTDIIYHRVGGNK